MTDYPNGGPVGKVKLADVYRTIYNEALAAAQKAIVDFGPENTKALNCGMAWVVVRPATHPFIKWCKRQGLGSAHWKSGWNFYQPGSAPVQQVDIHYAAAVAFAEVLKRSLTDTKEIFADSRLD